MKAIANAKTSASGAPEDGAALPIGWETCNVGDLIIHALGGEWGEPHAGFAGADMSIVSVIRSTEFRNWRTEHGSSAATRVVSDSSLRKRQLRPGDIVVEISGGGPDQPVGRTLLIDQQALAKVNYPMICSNFCRQIRIHPEMSAEFVDFALRHQYGLGSFNVYQTETTNIRNLNFPSFIANVQIPIPPVIEQRRIVAKVEELLERVNAARDRLRRVPGILKRLRQSVLAAACSGRLTADWREAHPDVETDGDSSGDDADLPWTWGWRRAGSLLREARYGTSTKCSSVDERGVPVLRVPNIAAGKLDLSDIKFGVLTADELSRLQLVVGDVLVCRTNGSVDLIGKAAVVPPLGRQHAFASYLIRLRVCPDELVPEFLHALLSAPLGRAQIEREARTSAGQFNLNLKILGDLRVPIPPIEEQHEIVRRVEALFGLADAIERRAAAATARVERLTQAILAKAFRGELVPTEAELARNEGRDYETAEALLDRIALEREHAGSKEA